MDKIKRLILVHVPISKCNLRCEYCYITLNKRWGAGSSEITHNPRNIGRAFSKKRLGGTCFINMCPSGETLLLTNIVDILKNILEQGHFVEIVTDGTLSKKFIEITRLPESLLQRLTFKFSFHYLELKRLNKLETFFNNIKKVKAKGCSFTVEMTPYDKLETHIGDIKEICMNELGALCHLTIARDDSKEGIPVFSKHTLSEYLDTWNQFESNMLNFKAKIFQVKRKEFCYAGDWTAYVNLGTGTITKCYRAEKIGNIYEFSKPVKFEAVGKCPLPHCYNGHAFLSFGVIPNITTPTYADIRNRKCVDCSEWLNPAMKDFMSGKLIDNNIEYSNYKKRNVLCFTYIKRASNRMKLISRKLAKKLLTQNQIDTIRGRN